MGSLKVYVDSSYRGKDGKCQCGYIFNNPKTRKMYMMSSDVFIADNNNDAEIAGIYIAIMNIYTKYGITDFLIYNDSVIGCSMLRDSATISKKTLNKYPFLKRVKKEFEEKGIKVKTVKLPRSDSMIKLCDKLSKEFRHR